jgi:aspartyl/glutamyl-tRNA(Asn/Gln) amidotransferase C subunit
MYFMEKSEIAHLAQLSYLNISDKNLVKFNQDFTGIIEHIETMSEVQEQVDTLPSYYHQTLREDVIKTAEERFGKEVRQNIFAGFPKKDNQALLVRTVLYK